MVWCFIPKCSSAEAPSHENKPLLVALKKEIMMSLVM